jgi:nitric oxide reductase NorD protein
MAEAEELITDAARHAAVYARDLWRRNRARTQRPQITLSDLANRLDALLAAQFGRSFPLRSAQPPAQPTFLTKVLRRETLPRTDRALAATDGESIWLPAALDVAEEDALTVYRTLALRQALRAARGGAAQWARLATPARQDLFTVIEAAAADAELMRLLPGIRGPLDALRRHALDRRPPLRAFAPARLMLERSVRSLLEGRIVEDFAGCETAAESARRARELETRYFSESSRDVPLLYKDWWSGDWRLPQRRATALEPAAGDADERPPRSARMARRPDAREPDPDEQDEQAGVWMAQSAQPHEQAEDPFGMQRPADRDAETAAEDHADALSELAEASLVSTPEKVKEILLAEDAPDALGRSATTRIEDETLAYPEWDWRLGAYRTPGARVHVSACGEGSQAWVDATSAAHRRMLDAVRRQFDSLRAQPLRLRKQPEGDEIDLEAYVAAYADFHAGHPLAQALYRTRRRARRDLALCLLIDVSGSTDAWVGGSRRIIDVEREALLIVTIALQSMSERFSVLAFSGEGPGGVRIRRMKDFHEPHCNTIARRIAALEPEHYTRAGAALRHATAQLMRESAHHRLLLLLSDGKPNDIDEYEGRYGTEDMQRAVTEARLQGISTFCLTIDRQASAYLPHIFGARGYALLPRPELLATALLDWIRRLMSA